MKKFFVAFAIPAKTMAEWMSSVSEAERKSQTDAMMKDWQTWMDKNAANIIDKGGPIGRTKRVTKGGVADSKNDLIYYIMMQGDSADAVAAICAESPHLAIPDAYIDVSGADRPTSM